MEKAINNARVKDIMPDRDIICCRGYLPVKEALKIMADAQVLSVPVYSSDDGRDCKAFFDMQDLIVALLEGKDPESMRLHEVENESKMDVFWPITPDVGLYHLTELFSRGVHRVPVVEEEGSFEVISIVSQSSLMHFLQSHVAAKDCPQTLESLEVITKDPISVTPDMTTREAFEVSRKLACDAVPVVRKEDSDDGKKGSLIGTLSLNCLRGLSSGFSQAIGLKVSEFIEKYPESPSRSFCCSAETTLYEAVALMGKKRAHRLWIVDENEVVVGVVTQSDIIRSVMKICSGTHGDHRRISFGAGK